MHKGLTSEKWHRWYVEEGGRGHGNFGGCLEVSTLGFKDYIKTRKEKLIEPDNTKNNTKNKEKNNKNKT